MDHFYFREGGIWQVSLGRTGHTLVDDEHESFLLNIWPLPELPCPHHMTLWSHDMIEATNSYFLSFFDQCTFFARPTDSGGELTCEILYL